MKAILLFLVVFFIHYQCNAILYNYVESQLKRTKRAVDCTSKYGDWSEWSTCSIDCGFCGKQSRSRTCIPVNGCSEPICKDDATETQSCGTDTKVCIWPLPSCCNKEYKKTPDFVGRRFFCSSSKDSSASTDSLQTLDALGSQTGDSTQYEKTDDLAVFVTTGPSGTSETSTLVTSSSNPTTASTLFPTNPEASNTAPTTVLTPSTPNI
ncbi:hypothetical protein CAEBREN_08692 [Caenorhabditis brenneri]|uniref:Uncharacterized protein n=1 Tax=Caenorhabditis brenneri TaxID=135651 RepID=G0MIF3_CAEBE|nr:hypothetical protein CAEBREN_08692 [Caenorhabditis brenneri]